MNDSQIRDIDASIKRRFNVRMYDVKKICPRCRSSNLIYRKDGLCYACLIKETAEAKAILARHFVDVTE